MPLRRKDVLDLDDFTADEITEVLDTAEAMSEVLARPIKRVPALRGTTIVNCFYEASTRTRVSFELAAKNLSADVVNMTASGSSVDKGESLIDTTRTLQALGANMVVMRHFASGAPYLVARYLEASVINAGDGWHAHPTQALLDVFTVRRHCGAISGLKVVIIGDILHSRVARSNVWAFSHLGAEVVLCGPPTLVPVDLVAAVASLTESKVVDRTAATAREVNGSIETSDAAPVGGNGVPLRRPDGELRDAVARPTAAAVATATRAPAVTHPQPSTGLGPRPPSRGRVSISYDLDEALAGADVVMALRLQRERQAAGLLPSLREYSRQYGLTRERVARAQRQALVMHPGPMNEGVEIMPDVARGSHSVIEEQVQNGVAVRMALLYLLAGGQSGLTPRPPLHPRWRGGVRPP